MHLQACGSQWVEERWETKQQVACPASSRENSGAPLAGPLVTKQHNTQRIRQSNGRQPHSSCIQALDGNRSKPAAAGQIRVKVGQPRPPRINQRRPTRPLYTTSAVCELATRLSGNMQPEWPFALSQKALAFPRDPRPPRACAAAAGQSPREAVQSAPAAP